MSTNCILMHCGSGRPLTSGEAWLVGSVLGTLFVVAVILVWAVLIRRR